ncbi:peptidyl-tRNA hydrolase [Corynebacterium atypicum]|uniref:Peptidyl-tRNA hydrolase n=1 Tax=Corynebacterium atypicum TaxID=191610 RepID=A0ABN4DCE4_9CORY|nr:aminoacyl-tRNA hydrolase [Corynebacterium atypicum]AIG63887.1 peptidyl-tRNA hydrolase [Corynebacterium atypicum]
MSSTHNTPLLVVGLGNPGPKYRGTRHNLGHVVLDELCSRFPQATFAVHKRSRALVAQARTAPGARGRALVMAKPSSLMNVSGAQVRALSDFFRVPAASILVVHDDLELPLGTVEARPGGGDRGHNGLRSITKALGTKDYVRISCGIGRPPGRMDPASFVLKPFSRREASELPVLAAHAADLIEERF